MAANITFFPVDNGDMTLLRLHDGRRILIDANIRADADDPEADDVPDVASALRTRLEVDRFGRPFVDVLVLSHPDQDHCRGLLNHFHLGPITDYPDDKKKLQDKRIVVREIWSSPIVFRRAEKRKGFVLCDDAKAFCAEARRRVSENRKRKFNVDDGDRITIMGEDIDGKTDDLRPILVKVDEVFSTICGQSSRAFQAQLLGPLPIGGDAEEEELSKNDSSVILNISIAADAQHPDGAKFLAGGDAEVGIWERIWDRHRTTAADLEFDVLQTPHHCSWHSLSADSWSELGEKARVSVKARKALSQARSGAYIIASSKPIKDDDVDPPCIRAKREYVDIAASADGRFMCTGEYPSESDPQALELTVTIDGVQPPQKTEKQAKQASALGAVARPLGHG
jgi:hypothetical protein